MNRRFAKPTEATITASTHERIADQARSSGKLNLSGKGFKSWPEFVWAIYEVDPKKVQVNLSSQNTWWEIVDLTRINAADNELPNVDARIAQYPSIEHLDLHGNQIEHVADEIRALEHLGYLNLTSNKLKEFPEAICHLPLVELRLSKNLLVTIKDGLRSLNKLQILDLSDNQIVQLPDNWTNFVSLRSLNLDRNKLQRLPSGMTGMPRLKELSAMENCLISTWNEPVSLPALERLDLRKNQISSFAKHTTFFPIVREILLSYNKLSSLETLLYTTPHLQVLELRQNSFEQLPNGLFALRFLTRLDIGANNISSLPSELGLVHSLQSVTYDGNPVRAVPRATDTASLLKILRLRLSDGNLAFLYSYYKDPEHTALELIKKDYEQVTKSLKEIGLNLDAIDSENKTKSPIQEAEPDVPQSNYFRSEEPVVAGPQVRYKSNGVPNVVIEMTPEIITTRIVKLNNRKFSDDPSLPNVVIPTLPDLLFSPGTLDLSHNLYKGFPNLALEFNATLIKLNLANNKLDHFPIPPEGIIFNALQDLDLSNNVIINWPTDANITTAFPEVNNLNLTRNRLTGTVPKDSFPLKKLKTLLLRGNKIGDINVEPFLNLEVLDLADNDIRHLPPDLGKCHGKLKQLSLEGNIFRIPRREILEKGTDAVLAWLKDRIKQ